MNRERANRRRKQVVSDTESEEEEKEVLEEEDVNRERANRKRKQVVSDTESEEEEKEVLEEEEDVNRERANRKRKQVVSDTESEEESEEEEVSEEEEEEEESSEEVSERDLGEPGVYILFEAYFDIAPRSEQRDEYYIFKIPEEEGDLGPAFRVLRSVKSIGLARRMVIVSKGSKMLFSGGIDRIGTIDDLPNRFFMLDNFTDLSTEPQQIEPPDNIVYLTNAHVFGPIGGKFYYFKFPVMYIFDAFTRTWSEGVVMPKKPVRITREKLGQKVFCIRIGKKIVITPDDECTINPPNRIAAFCTEKEEWHPLKNIQPNPIPSNKTFPIFEGNAYGCLFLSQERGMLKLPEVYVCEYVKSDFWDKVDIPVPRLERLGEVVGLRNLLGVENPDFVFDHIYAYHLHKETDPLDVHRDTICILRGIPYVGVSRQQKERWLITICNISLELPNGDAGLPIVSVTGSTTYNLFDNFPEDGLQQPKLVGRVP